MMTDLVDCDFQNRRFSTDIYNAGDGVPGVWCLYGNRSLRGARHFAIQPAHMDQTLPN